MTRQANNPCKCGSWWGEWRDGVIECKCGESRPVPESFYKSDDWGAYTKAGRKSG